MEAEKTGPVDSEVERLGEEEQLMARESIAEWK
jgi:hypothetical protein